MWNFPSPSQEAKLWQCGMAVPSGPLFCLRCVFSVPCPVLRGQLGSDSRPLHKGDGGDGWEEPGNALPFSAALLLWGLSLAVRRGPPRSEHSQRGALEALGLTAQKQPSPSEHMAIAH